MNSGDSEIHSCKNCGEYIPLIVDLKQQLATTKAELDKVEIHLAIEESECVRLCNEKNNFKAELQAERAKAGDLIQEISVLRQYGNKDCTAMADEYLESLKPKGNNNAN
jgi:phage host-nuclease inhibitor protein Gam